MVDGSRIECVEGCVNVDGDWIECVDGLRQWWWVPMVGDSTIKFDVL